SFGRTSLEHVAVHPNDASAAAEPPDLDTLAVYDVVAGDARFRSMSNALVNPEVDAVVDEAKHSSFDVPRQCLLRPLPYCPEVPVRPRPDRLYPSPCGLEAVDLGHENLDVAVVRVLEFQGEHFDLTDGVGVDVLDDRLELGRDDVNSHDEPEV